MKIPQTFWSREEVIATKALDVRMRGLLGGRVDAPGNVAVGPGQGQTLLKRNLPVNLNCKGSPNS